MKRIIFLTILIVGLTATYGFTQMGGHMESGMMGQAYDDESYEYSQVMGPGMMGSGMMGGYGMPPCMMGSGMMGRGMMGRGMMGPGHMGGMMGGYGTRVYDAEDYKKYQKEYQKYMDDTVELRRKVHNKKFDYYEALRNPDTTRKSLLKIEKEMHDLQWELYEKAPR